MGKTLRQLHVYGVFERFRTDDVMHIRMPWRARTHCGQSFASVYHEYGDFPTCIYCIGMLGR